MHSVQYFAGKYAFQIHGVSIYAVARRVAIKLGISTNMANKDLIFAIYYKHQELLFFNESEKPKDYKHIEDFYKSWDWKRTRYDFLQNKARRCECCGATPNDGIRIVVDHIKPIRLYWHLRLEQTNLQLLCDDCNMGKGSHDETDWRKAKSN
jgi:hypothetical protein